MERRTSHPILKNDLQRVLAIQLASSSDVVMLSPALRTLREALPNSEITLMTSEAGSQVAVLLPWIDNVMTDQAVWRESPGHRSLNPREDVALIERLRQQNYSLAFIFTSISQSPQRAAYACYLAGIPFRVGYANEPKDSLMLSHFLHAPNQDVHQVDRNLHLLEAVGISGRDKRVELEIPESVEKKANELLGAAGLRPELPYLVLAPGSTQALSEYDPNHFADVAHLLAAQTELQLVLVGSSAEAKTIHAVLQLANENLYGNIFSVVEKTDLPELAAIIRRASLTLTNHSISMHLADAFGCPMVILYAESEMISQWAPRTAQARLISRPAACLSCSYSECPHGIHCPDVRPEEIAVAALELLTWHTYNQDTFRNVFGYEMKSENQSSAMSD